MVVSRSFRGPNATASEERGARGGRGRLVLREGNGRELGFGGPHGWAFGAVSRLGFRPVECRQVKAQTKEGSVSEFDKKTEIQEIKKPEIQIPNFSFLLKFNIFSKKYSL